MRGRKQLDSTLSITEKIRVNFYDADPLGIVWHGNYLKYFEIAREAFGRKYGISYLDIKEHGFATPIVKTSTEYMHPLKYGDIAIVTIEFINSMAAKMTFNYTISNVSGALICRGQTVQVFTDFISGELSLINPQFYSNWKTQNGLSID